MRQTSIDAEQKSRIGMHRKIGNTSSHTDNTPTKPLEKEQILNGFVASFYNCKENLLIQDKQEKSKTKRNKPKQVLYFNGNLRTERDSIPTSSAQTPCFLHTPNHLGTQSPKQKIFSDKQRMLGETKSKEVGLKLQIQSRHKSEDKPGVKMI